MSDISVNTQHNIEQWLPSDEKVIKIASASRPKWHIEWLNEIADGFETFTSGVILICEWFFFVDAF